MVTAVDPMDNNKEHTIRVFATAKTVAENGPRQHHCFVFLVIIAY